MISRCYEEYIRQTTFYPDLVARHEEVRKWVVNLQEELDLTESRKRLVKYITSFSLEK